MINLLLEIISVFLLSSSLALVTAQFLVEKVKLNFFNNVFSGQIISFSHETAVAKTYDILYFILIIFFSILIFLIYKYFSKENTSKNTTFNCFNLFFSVLIFLQTHFVRHSGKGIFAFVVIFQAIYLWLVNKYKKKIMFSGWLILANSFLSGFFIMLIVRRFTTSLIIVMGTIILLMFVYQIISGYSLRKYLSSPAHLILFLSVFNSWNVYYLILLGVVTLLGTILVKKYPKWLTDRLSLIYSLTLVSFLVYNPNFYFGNLDSVEEGFWLGWLQRLLSGQVLYRDVAVYHPPLIIWGLAIFEKLFGISIYIFRLYLQILKLIGILIVFITLRKLIKDKILLFLLTILSLSFLTPYVKNNVEIRVGVGLLALYVIGKYYEIKNVKYLFIGGLVSCISFFVSVEVGVSAMIAAIIGILFTSKQFKSVFKEIAVYFSGIIIPSGIIFGYLYSQRALIDFIKQVYFYSRAFSSGYFNVAINRFEVQNILQWWRVDRYLSSTAFLWEFVWFSLAVTGMYLIYRFKAKLINKVDIYVLMILVFNLVLARASLGRSDSYHLIFILISSVPLVIYCIDSLTSGGRYKNIPRYLLVGLLLIVLRVEFMQVFVNDQLLKLQSYGNISQRYNILQSKRSGIALDIDAPYEDIDALTKFIETNTSKTDTVFSYPWQPEIYFLTDRNNATSFDTPYSFFTLPYQKKMINELDKSKPKYIIYNPDMNFAGMTVSSLLEVDNYIKANYKIFEKFGKYNVMSR